MKGDSLLTMFVGEVSEFIGDVFATSRNIPLFGKEIERSSHVQSVRRTAEGSLIKLMELSRNSVHPSQLGRIASQQIGSRPWKRFLR